MLNKRILTHVLTSLITLTLIFVLHQLKEPVIHATTNSLGSLLAAAPISNRDDLTQRFQKILDSQVAQGVPGVTMYIKTADGWTWSGASGWSNLQEHIPMKASDRFRIMSATKTFVATVILQLAQEGKLGEQGLDNTINHLLPVAIANRIPNRDRITVRHLLNHSSGLVNYSDGERYKRETNSNDTIDNIIDWAFGKDSKPPSFEPGTRFEYSDTNYIVAELIVQHLTGNSLAYEIRKRILTPLKLDNTYMERIEAGAVAGSGLVHGYIEDTGQSNKPVTRDFTNSGDVLGVGDGGIISNAEDLGKFLTGLFHDKSLLNEKFLNQMVNFKNHVGLGVFEEQVPGGRAWGHSGTWNGYNTQMYLLPDRNVAAVALGNGNNANPQRVLQEALGLLF